MFLPLSNPLGMGIADFVALALAALLVASALLWRPWLEPLLARLAQRPVWCLLLIFALPVVLRLLLLPRHPAPVPDIYDEFSHLLVADTLRHFRLANPPLPLPQFFETFFILQSPTYSSIYPIGQGFVLAIGWTLFGTPWAGVILATAAFCALCYWMLRGWTTPGWALAGGILAALNFGPLNQWMNSYWGGSLPAAAGCLVFGALPRLRRAWRSRDALLLGAGLSIHLLTRPYESVFLLLCVGLYLLPVWKLALRSILLAALMVLPAIGITFLQNQLVTGSWTTLPYALSQYQYGVPSALTFEPNATPHRDLTPEQQLDYKMQLSFRGDRPETPATYFLRLAYRIRYYRFFFMPPLYLALPFFVLALRDRQYLWVALWPVILALGVNFFPGLPIPLHGGSSLSLRPDRSRRIAAANPPQPVSRAHRCPALSWSVCPGIRLADRQRRPLVARPAQSRTPRRRRPPTRPSPRQPSGLRALLAAPYLPG